MGRDARSLGGERRDRVEVEPAEPEDQRAQHLQQPPAQHPIQTRITKNDRLEDAVDLLRDPDELF